MPTGGCRAAERESGPVGAAVGVLLLLALIWAAVLVPPALRSHAARQEAFLVSLGSTPAPEPPRPPSPLARASSAGGASPAAC